MLQSMAVILTLFCVAESMDLTRNRRSALLTTTEETNSVKIHFDERRRHQANHGTEAPTNLSTTFIPDTRRTLQQEIPREPRCVAHREYAVIIPTSKASDLMLRFMSNNGEIRYYYCRTCSRCRPGVRIARPCYKRRDTLCSPSECIYPDYFFDPVTQACYPPMSSTTRRPHFMTSSRAIFASASGGDEVVDDKVVSVSTTPSPGKIIFAFAWTLTGLVLLITGLVLITSLQLLKRAAKSKRSCQSTSCHSTVSAVIRSPAITRTCESPTINMVVDLSQDLAISTLDHQATLMKQPRYEEASESSHNQEHNLSNYDGGDEVINGAVSVLKGTSPYWLVMMGHFGPEGGVLSCDDSDVVLEIPPGAIPASHPHQFIKAKVSLTPAAAAPKLMNDPDFLCLTPVVEFESPGLNNFSKNVLIRLPHKACMAYDPSWTFRAHFTDPTPATKNQGPKVVAFPAMKDPLNRDPWYFVDLKHHMSGKSSQIRCEPSRGVSCTVDEKYFNISTPHFSKYVCSGCHKNHRLQFETVIYASHLKGKGYEEVKLIIYIMDPIKDCRKMVEQEQNEASPPRTRVSEYHRVSLDYNKKCKDNRFLEVTLMPDGMARDWQWKLQYEGHVKAQLLIGYDDLIRCCSSLGPFLHTFHLEPKATEEPLSVFNAMICFGQQPQRASPHREPVKVIITLPLSGQQRYGRGIDNTRNKHNFGSTVVSEDQIDVVLTKLLPKDWRRLFRRLMGKDVENEIQGIVARNPNDVHEQKHDALFIWKRSHGRAATVDVLVSALRNLDLTDIAESLGGIKDTYELKETSL